MDDEQVLKAFHEGLDSILSVVHSLSNNIASLDNEIGSLNSQIGSLNNEVGLLKEENQAVHIKITELESKLNKNSKNSSKPPSSDGYSKPPVNKANNSRVSSGRSTGGQDNHTGHTIAFSENPTNVVKISCHTNTCTCGCCLDQVAPTVQRRQVFDIPVIPVEVTEYQAESKECPNCGKRFRGEFPEGVTAPVQYGENIRAVVAYLHLYQLIPLARTSELISDMTGGQILMSEGTIVNIAKELSKNLDEVDEAIKNGLLKAPVIYMDETGMRNCGKTEWIFTASTPKLTHLHGSSKRGAEGMDAAGFYAEYDGCMMHDHWKSYYNYIACTHAECNAHHIRNLKGIIDNFGHEWAKVMTGFLIRVKCHVEYDRLFGSCQMDEEIVACYFKEYHEILETGVIENAQKTPNRINEKTGKEKYNKASQLIRKLEKYDIETLAFLCDYEIAFDNNLAERDLRMSKLRQKISGCFRGTDGRSVFCKVRSYVSTMKKQGHNILESMRNAIVGKATMPDIT